MQEMKRKEYEQPKTDVVELRVTCQLLAGSTGIPDMPDYPDGGDPFNP